MGLIATIISIPQPPDSFNNLEEVQEYLHDESVAIHDQLSELADEFNGRIELINKRCAIVTVTDTGTADNDFAVTHNLGTATVYYIPNINSTTLSAATSFYKGATSWTTNSLYLKSKVANLNVTFLVMA
jgi:hypothetical protein